MWLWLSIWINVREVMRIKAVTLYWCKMSLCTRMLIAWSESGRSRLMLFEMLLLVLFRMLLLFASVFRLRFLLLVLFGWFVRFGFNFLLVVLMIGCCCGVFLGDHLLSFDH